jgi:hypothetical protein
MLAAVDTYGAQVLPRPQPGLLVNIARLDLLLLGSIVFMMVTKVGE